MRNFGYLAVLWTTALAPSAVFADPQRLDKPGKKIRFISLAEAVAIALEGGSNGQPSMLFPGIGLDNLGTAPKDESTVPMRVIGKPGSKSILVTGVPCDRRRIAFERNINQALLNIETAYWNLYGSYFQLYSREMALRLAYMTYMETEQQYEDGRLSQAAVAQAEGQYNLFRCQRLAALDTVLDNERQLRAMLGIKIKDGTRLVPSDAPTLVKKKPDWKEGLHSTMKKRPELQMARQDVQLASWKATITEEVADYIPLSDEVREAELQLARSRLVLQDQELKAERYLGLWYRRMSSAYFQIKAAQAQRESFAKQFLIRFELFSTGANEPGSGKPVALSLLLEVQRFWAEALATEYQAIVTYNDALVGWEFAKADIMKHAHVRFAEEVPDHGEVVPAVQREHKRTRQRVRHEPPLGCGGPVLLVDFESDKKAAPSLPALGKCLPLLKEVGDVQTGLVEGRVVH